MTESNYQPALAENGDLVLNKRTGHRITREQAALERAALAFYDKHGFVQYDQFGMISANSGDPLSVYNTRRECFATPEAVSEERITHLDCSSFVWAIYDNAFGNAAELFPPKTGLMEPYVLKESEQGRIAPDMPVVYLQTIPEQERTEENQQRILDEMRAILQPGDLILYRREIREKNKNGGHVVMYLDGDYTIEVRGGSYDYAAGKDNVEEGGAILLYPLNELLFSPAGGKRYIFGKENVYLVSILRPLNTGKCHVTQECAARMQLAHLSVTKRALPEGQTVRPGQEFAFTVELNNAAAFGTSEDLTVTVTDPLPSNACFVSADNGGELIDGVVTWKDIPIANGETRALQYTVKVSAENGFVTSGRGAVNGLPFGYRDIEIAKDLTDAQCAELLRRLDGIGQGGGTALSRINAILRDVLGKDLGTDDAEKLLGAIYAPYADKKGEPRFRVAPDRDTAAAKAWISAVVIGRHVMNTTDEEYTARVRYLREESLKPADILAVCSMDGEKLFYVYRGAGQDMLRVTDGSAVSVDTAETMESLLMYQRCVLLRPGKLC